MRLWLLPTQVWQPLALGALAPLAVGAVYILFSRRRQHRIAAVLTLRSVLLLGFGFGMLAAVATISVVRAGLRELQERHAATARTLADVVGSASLGPTSSAAQLSLALYRAKDPSVAFVAVGADHCLASCLVNAADLPGGTGALKARLAEAWPGRDDVRPTLSMGDRVYLLSSAAVFDAAGKPGAQDMGVVAGIDATYIVDSAARTAWALLGISYLVLALVAWMSWHQIGHSLATRMNAITTQLNAGVVEDSIELLPADGKELRELADSVAHYVKRTLEQQELADERHRRLVELSPDGIFICSAAGIRFANSAGLALAGVRNRHDVLGLRIEQFLEFEKDAFMRDLSAMSLKPARWTRRDGKILQVHVAEIADTMSGDQVRQYVVRDVTHEKIREADLAHRADHDSLTGLVNRSRFLARLTELVQTHAMNRRAEVREAAVLYIDLDGFKPVNDKFGHAAGDAVLVAVADRLRESTRGTDVAARLGGDEFAVLLEVHEAAEITTVAERVLRSLTQPVSCDSGRFTVGASIGTSRLRQELPDKDAIPARPPAGQSAHLARTLMRQADTAMYAAKSEGGSRIVPYSESTELTPQVSFPAVA